MTPPQPALFGSDLKTWAARKSQVVTVNAVEPQGGPSSMSTRGSKPRGFRSRVVLKLGVYLHGNMKTECRKSGLNAWMDGCLKDVLMDEWNGV